MAESEYDYPLAVPVFAHIAVVAIAGAAVAQRDGFVPPGWVLLCGLVAAVTPVAGDMIRPRVELPRPFLAVVVIAAAALLLLQQPDTAFDFAPLILVILIAEVAANNTPPNVNGGDGGDLSAVVLDTGRSSMLVPHRIELPLVFAAGGGGGASTASGMVSPRGDAGAPGGGARGGATPSGDGSFAQGGGQGCSDPTGRARRGLPVVPDTAAAQEVPGRRFRRPSVTGSGPGVEVGPAGTAVVGAPPGDGSVAPARRTSHRAAAGRTLPRAVGRHDRTVVAGFGAHGRRHLRASLKGLPEQRSATGPYMRDSKSRQNVSAKSWLSPEK
ncbi:MULTISPECIES: hypothetical protein [Rhodococcus]|uniref:Sensor kinase, two-component system n=1 Tax=Rhodococcus opacus RKJ300 = JCM 13270 TaxID=1165867 RepID=I0WM76_RHOOP|nr:MULTISPECIES: hypothetical protein [Rhodococcus]EID77492.1 sensor kinase, two-component system [Rhodococcus opacus RKJ300 = JCM 13270]